MESLATWLVNPWLFVVGLAAAALTLIIHLLNRRKYRLVEWAAMEFMLAANQENRRRIRIENLALLVLRCLAVALIGLLLARPFIPTGFTSEWVDAAQFERIVVLDDSLSMQARQGNESAWEASLKSVDELVAALAHEGSENSLTLILTSRPERRILDTVALNAATLDEIRQSLKKLAVNDGALLLEPALATLNDALRARPANVNRVVYVFSDLRLRDWTGATTGLLERLARQVQGCYVIDAHKDDVQNLSIVEIRPDGMLVAGTSAALDVAVLNQGTETAGNVRVNLRLGDALPLEGTIERIAPHETEVARFQVQFADDKQNGRSIDQSAPRRIEAELELAEPADDRLAADNIRYFAAQVAAGVPVLLVDGDAGAEPGQEESFFLHRALSPAGPQSSGIVVEVMTASEMDSVDLNTYRVVFLLNVDRLGAATQDNVKRMGEWVAGGGGLVIMPGDQTDERQFNEQFTLERAGLSPIELLRVRGDASEETWVQLRATDTNHPVFKPFAGQDNPLLSGVKVFRWWEAKVRDEQPGSRVSVLARFSDPETSPAIVEKSIGKGRVVAFAFAADADWHHWASDPSYLLVMQELVRYLAADGLGQNRLRVGEPIRERIDVADYEIEATLRGPRGSETQLQAAPTDSSKRNTEWQFAHTADAPGFYEFVLKRRNGGKESRVVAVNVDPAEGNLQRIGRRELARSLAGASIKVVGAEESIGLAATGSRTEVWWYLLWAVAAALAGEQFLGWFFGRRRA